jgi:hypothetical protein
MRILLSGLGAVALLLASCSSGDLGTGMNTVDRNYTASVQQAHDASLATVKDEKLQVEKDAWDNLGGEVVARRASDPNNKVLISVRALDPNNCEVSVRVEPGNKDQAEMMQTKIGEKLTPSAK